MVDKLLGGEDGRRESGAEHHRIKTLFQAAEQLFVRLTGTGLRLGVSDAELLLADRVVVLEFLLLHQQFTVGGELDPAALAVRTGRIRTLDARALRIAPDALADPAAEFVFRSTCGWHNQSLSFYVFVFRKTGVKPSSNDWGPNSGR